MAKFRVNPELVKVLVPVVVPLLKDLAAKTSTTVDDRLVEVVEKVTSNPVLFAILLSLLAGETPEPASATDADADVLVENADVLKGLFSVAVAPDGETA